MTYSLPDILREIQQKFQLEDSVEATNSLRKKVEKVCKNIPVSKGDKEISLWQKVYRKPKPKSGQTVGPGKHGESKPRYVFTEYDRQLLLEDPELYKYAIPRTKNSESPQVKAAIAEAERRNAETELKLDGLTPEEYFNEDLTRMISDEEGLMFETYQRFLQTKLEFMITALYLEFFEPINDRELYSDLKAQHAPSATGVSRIATAMSIQAEERLRNPLNYCKRKEKGKKES